MSRVIIDRKYGGGLVVEIDPVCAIRRRTFALPLNPNRRFSRALGYAATLAAALGFDMVDSTGRLSEAECRALVALQWQGVSLD